MKTVYLVRHAKSSWEDDSLADFDRPLSARGLRDAPRMGKRFKEREILPGVLISSPAARALATCQAIAKCIDFPRERIVTDRKLYHADEEELLSVILHADDKHDSLMLFGHNPGLTDFANSLSENDNLIRNIPTCGIVCFQFKCDRWSDVKPGEAKFIFFDFPKSKDD